MQEPLLSGGRPLARYTFFTVWILATVGLGWLVLRGPHTFDQPAIIPALLIGVASTAALLWWLPGPPIPERAATSRTRRGRFFFIALAAGLGLFVLVALIGRAILFVLPVVGVLAVTLCAWGPYQREILYVLRLAVLAGLAGLGAGWITYISPAAWAALQVPLVLCSFLGGWAILRRVGLLQAGIGRSTFLIEGRGYALWCFVQGAVLAFPWALLNVALGGANHDTWVKAWWQPLVAIQPAISEEAWGRVLLVALLFWVLRRTGRARVALTTAVIIAGYWFAYLHTSGNVANRLVSTSLMGTVFSLPISYVWLRRGLETAIGFHFFMDFFRFAVAYLVNQGFWLR